MLCLSTLVINTSSRMINGMAEFNNGIVGAKVMFSRT